MYLALFWITCSIFNLCLILLGKTYFSNRKDLDFSDMFMIFVIVIAGVGGTITLLLWAVSEKLTGKSIKNPLYKGD